MRQISPFIMHFDQYRQTCFSRQRMKMIQLSTLPQSTCIRTVFSYTNGDFGTGHPLRRLVNSKKMSVPVFSSSGLPSALSNGCEENCLDPFISSPDFGPASLETIRSVTHLVLALIGRAVTSSHF